MLDIARAARDGLDIYRDRLSVLIKLVLPVLIARQLLAAFYSSLVTGLSPSWLFTGIGVAVGESAAAIAIYIGISVCLADAPVKPGSLNWSPGTLFVVWLTTVCLSIAISLPVLLYGLLTVHLGIFASLGFPLLFWVVMGLSLVVMGLSLFYPIYIVKYDQGPIESVASSVRAAKDSWLRVSAMVAVLWAVWCGAEWAAYAVTGGVDAGVTLLGTVVAVVTSAVYMYLYAITVSAWVQLDNAR